MRKIKSVLTLATLLLAFTFHAQQHSVSNVLNLKSAKQSGTIIEDSKIVGYFIFYFKEKQDKKTSTYEIELFDDNYNSLKSFEVTRPKNTYMLEMVFNGEVFMLHFYDAKTGYEFVTYNRDGEVVGSKKIPKEELGYWELNRATTNIQSATENTTIFPTGKTGFVRQTFTKGENRRKYGYEIVAYNNEMDELWSYGSDPNSEIIEGADLNDATTKVIAATVTKKKNISTKKMDTYCLLLNASTGELIKEISMGGEDEGKKSLLKTFVDESKETILLIGEYYKPGDDILKDKSQGMFLDEVSMSGSLVSSTEYKWKGDVDKFKQENISDEDKKEADKQFYLFFHDVIRTSDGRLYLVAEQYRKQLSAGGTAVNVLAAAAGGSSNASNFEILVGNMVVIEFDATNKMTGYDLISKRKTSVLLPAGAGFWNTAFLGYYINSMGAFDYAFTSNDKKGDRYSVVYIDANRKEEKGAAKSDLMVGVIQIDGGERTNSRVPINMESRFWWIQAAKPGYISVGEYFRKEKRIDLRLEPIAY
ncbi:MAG: hypothetical protein QE487_07445 [Fluviicola sp.]|nr:hypothetical protein [Fluviicola sp.]